MPQISSNLLEYVKKQKSLNVSEDEIVSKLTQVGWNEGAIKSALLTLSEEDIPLPPMSSSGGLTVNYDHKLWDTFQYILMFITMCVYAFSLNMLQHTLINFAFDGSSNSMSIYNSYSYGGYYSNAFVTGTIAAIFVSLPIFLFLFLKLKYQTIKNPELKALHSRKVLIYGTLVVTFIVVLGNVISIIYQMLSGELGIRNIFHFLSPVVISGLIFSYFIKEARTNA